MAENLSIYNPNTDTADISIIYQDHYLLIVNKPAGLVIHPTYKHADSTLWDALLAYSMQQGQDDWQPPVVSDEPGWAFAPPEIRTMLRNNRLQRVWKEDGLLPRPCLLHRLDKDTSGLVALARTERARRHVVKQFIEHTIEKRYLALVQQGAPDWAQPRTAFTVQQRDASGQLQSAAASFVLAPPIDAAFVLSGPLLRDPDERRRCIVSAAGQASTTVVRVLAVEGGYALLDVRPVTGRTHQIRAHLAALGYAIVGDQTYGLPAADTDAPALNRQFLHAYSLSMRRYPGNSPCTFVAPLAADLEVWLARTCPAIWQFWQAKPVSGQPI